MEELQLHLHGAHEADREKPGESFPEARLTETYRNCFINEHVIEKVLNIQPYIRA